MFKISISYYIKIAVSLLVIISTDIFYKNIYAQPNCYLTPDIPVCNPVYFPLKPKLPFPLPLPIRPKPPFPSPLPTKVDLTSYQSPVKKQGSRNTCGTFVIAAALEAAYKRNYNLDLDLSEQYINHWSQSLAISNRDLPKNENASGAIGGGGIIRPLAALIKGLGVPPETALPYIDYPGYETPENGDKPDIMDWSILYPQRMIDDFNLSDSANEYIFLKPNITTTTIMPLNALVEAKYRSKNFIYPASSEINSLNWYKNQLRLRREIAVDMRCCDGNPGGASDVWNLPANSNGGDSGHAVLIVGYDDLRQAFRVKNSWGENWGNNGYAWLSYDFVTKGVIYSAVVLENVVNPQDQFDVWTNKQLYLGRWNLDFDGWKGILDIYHLPNTQNSNYRLGTLFMPDGTAQRVNGKISGNRLDFWTDSSNPNQPMSDNLSNTKSYFTTYLFSRDYRSMAGSVKSSDGNTYGVQALKGKYHISGNANPGGLRLDSYLGTWNLNFDGWNGKLLITAIDPQTRAITASYVDNNGVTYPVTGAIINDTRLFYFVINFPSPQTFSGFLNGWELGVMSGTTILEGRKVGFYGTRI